MIAFKELPNRDDWITYDFLVASKTYGSARNGVLVNNVGATHEQAADWILEQTLWLRGDESRLGWHVALYIGQKKEFTKDY